MKRWIGNHSNGKTTQMVKEALNLRNELNNRIIFVTQYPQYIQGIINGVLDSQNDKIQVISYKDFINKLIKSKDNWCTTIAVGGYSEKEYVYIDEIESFLKMISDNIKGYTLGLENISIN